MAGPIDRRIDIERFDRQTIDRVSSEIVRALTEVAEEDPDVQGAFHIKIGHIRVGFSRSGHVEIIVGNPEPDEPDQPDGGGAGRG
jgi:hypothetical protein